MRVIGIDPGSRRLGWGVIEIPASGPVNSLRHVASGTLKPPDGALSGRLRFLADALDALLQEHRPGVGAVEGVFHAKNSQSALILGHARGVALLSLARFELEVFEYSATEIKQAATGSGRGDKEQVQRMVQLVLGTQHAMGLDTSDALATAICHAQRHSSRAHQLARSLGGRR